MTWCEAHDVSYVLGLARNARLEALLVPSLDVARARQCLCGCAASRVFAEFSYRTQKSWSPERRVIGKAEVTSQGNNPRFSTAPATVRVWTVRLRLLKIAGHVNVSVHRVYVCMASACPMQARFAQCQRRLMALDPAPA